MKHKRVMVLVVVLVLVVVASGCAPSGGEPAMRDAGADQTGEGSATAADSAADPNATTAPGGPGSGVGQVVDGTPLSEAELAAQPTSQTQGGAAEDDAGQTEPDVPDQPSAGWTIYTSDVWGFRVTHPADFLVREPNATLLSALVPVPDAAVYFVSPTIVESALAGTDAPDLEVRIHETGDVASLTDWLSTTAGGADQTAAPYQLGDLPGIEVCGSTMAFPQCSVFVTGNGRVYQLRWISQEGETMAQSFTIVP